MKIYSVNDPEFKPYGRVVTGLEAAKAEILQALATTPLPAATDYVAEDKRLQELPAAVEVVLETGQASVSMLQRRLKLGYSRAARIIDQIEDRGIIGPSEGSKPRQILISREDWQEMKLRRTMPLDKQQ